MPNFSSSGFANASSYSKFVKLLQDISMTIQFHRNFFAVLVWQIIWSQSFDCLFWESFSPLCNGCFRILKKTWANANAQDCIRFVFELCVMCMVIVESLIEFLVYIWRNLVLARLLRTQRIYGVQSTVFKVYLLT